MKQWKWRLSLVLLLHVALILLMAFPIGAVLRFGHPDPAVKIYRTFAYFDPGVLGMSGNPFPFLTAVLTALAFLLLVWMLLRQTPSSRLYAACFGCTVAAAVTSVLALFLLSRVSVAGVTITALLVASGILQHLTRPLLAAEE